MNNYLYNPYFWMPPVPNINLNPPTLYSLLESIVNYGKDDKTKIKDLAKAGRTEIFDFDYDLTDRLSKEEFETHILNHYLMRRIGFETLTAFKIQLNCKINEIVPIFNKLYNSIENWDLFTGDETIRTGTDNTITESTNNSSNNLRNSSNTNTNSISDRRYSDTPENKLEDIRDGSYVTDYNYDTDTTTSEDNSSSNGSSTSNTNTNDNKVYEEKITHTASPLDKLEIIKNIQTEITNIYKIVYNELDNLFYGIIN